MENRRNAMDNLIKQIAQEIRKNNYEGDYNFYLSFLNSFNENIDMPYPKIKENIAKSFENLRGIISKSKFLKLDRSRNTSDDLNSLNITSNYSNAGKGYKLNISFNPKYIDKAIKKLFKFIEKKGIDVYANVKCDNTNNSLSIVVSDQEDVDKIVNFVNKKLSKYCLNGNPFLMNNGTVSISHDNGLDFNRFASLLLKKYFSSNKDLRSASLTDFRNFVINYYKEIFITKTRMLEFVKDELFEKYDYANKQELSDGFFLEKYEKMFKYLMDSLENNYTLELYEKFVENSYNKDLRKKRIKKYDDDLELQKLNTLEEIQKYIKGKEKTPIPEVYIDSSSYNHHLFDEYLDFILDKYGYEESCNILVNYLHGNINAIDEENLYRERFKTYISPSLILLITGGNIVDYVKNAFKNKDKREKSTYNFISLANFLIEALVETVNKFNYEKKDLVKVIENILNGNLENITNGNKNYRQKLEELGQEVTKKCILTIVLNNGFSSITEETLASDLADIVMDEVLKEEILNQGISY